MPTLVHVNVRKSTHTVSLPKNEVCSDKHHTRFSLRLAFMQHFYIVHSSNICCLDLVFFCCFVYVYFFTVDLQNKCIGCQEGARHWNDVLKICQDDCCCGMVNHKDTGTCNCPEGLHLIDGTCGKCSEIPGERTKLAFVTKEVGDKDVDTVSGKTKDGETVFHKTDSREAKCICDDDDGYHTVPANFFTDRPIDTCLKCPTAEAPTHTRLNDVEHVCEPACVEGHIYALPNTNLFVNGQPDDDQERDVKICRCPDDTPYLIDGTCSLCPSLEVPLPAGGHVCKNIAAKTLALDGVGVGAPTLFNDGGLVPNQEKLPDKKCSDAAFEMAEEGIKGFSITTNSDGTRVCSFCTGDDYVLEADSASGTSQSWYLGPYGSVFPTSSIIQRTEFNPTDPPKSETQQRTGECRCPSGRDWSKTVQSCIKCPDDQDFNDEAQLCKGPCDENSGEEWNFELGRCACEEEIDTHVLDGVCAKCDGVRKKFKLEVEPNTGRCECEEAGAVFWFDKQIYEHKDGDTWAKKTVGDEQPVKIDIRYKDPEGAKCIACTTPPNLNLNPDIGACEPTCTEPQKVFEAVKCPAQCLCPPDKPHLVPGDDESPTCVACPGGTRWFPDDAPVAATQSDGYNIFYSVHATDPCRHVVGFCGCPPELPNLEDKETGTCTKCDKNRMFSKANGVCEISCPYTNQIIDKNGDCVCPEKMYVQGQECLPCEKNGQTRFEPDRKSEPHGPGTCDCPEGEHRVLKEEANKVTTVVACLKCEEPNPKFDPDTQQCSRDCPEPLKYYLPTEKHPKGYCDCPEDRPHLVKNDGGKICTECGKSEEDNGQEFKPPLEQLDEKGNANPGECGCPNDKPHFGKVKGGKKICIACDDDHQWSADEEICAEKCFNEKQFGCESSTYFGLAVTDVVPDNENAPKKTRKECSEGQEVAEHPFSRYGPYPKTIHADELDRRAAACDKLPGCTWYQYALTCLPNEEPSPFEQICTCECPKDKPDMLPKSKELKTTGDGEHQCGTCKEVYNDDRIKPKILDPDTDILVRTHINQHLHPWVLTNTLTHISFLPILL